MNHAYVFLIVLPTVACNEMNLTYYLKPYGPKMCERFCQHIVGCSSVHFSTDALLCDVCEKGDPSLDGVHEKFTEIIVKQVFIPLRSTCPANFKVVYNRARDIICLNPALTSDCTRRRDSTVCTREAKEIKTVNTTMKNIRKTSGASIIEKSIRISKDSKEKQKRTRDNNIQDENRMTTQAAPKSKNAKVKRHARGYRVKRVRTGVMSFKKYSMKKTWDDAMSYCQEEAAHLVKVNTKDKLGAVRSLFNMLQLSRHGVVWIGLRDIHRNNTFFWIDGDRLTFRCWDQKEPSHNYKGVDEDCVAADSSWSKTTWTDRVCGNTYEFICQLKSPFSDSQIP